MKNPRFFRALVDKPSHSLPRRKRQRIRRNHRQEIPPANKLSRSHHQSCQTLRNASTLTTGSFSAWFSTSGLMWPARWSAETPSAAATQGALISLTIPTWTEELAPSAVNQGRAEHGRCPLHHRLASFAVTFPKDPAIPMPSYPSALVLILVSAFWVKNKNCESLLWDGQHSLVKDFQSFLFILTMNFSK